MGASNEDFMANTISIAQTGRDVQANAVNLGDDVMQQINSFEYETASLAVPSCLQKELDPYITTHKAELEKMVQKRHNIGALLSKASDLVAFNEQMIASGFNKLYQNVDSFYGGSGDSTNPANMQRATGFVVKPK